MNVIDWQAIQQFISAIASAVTSFPKLVNQALGSLTAISGSWTGVNVIGGIIATMLLSIVFFLVFDAVRDLL